MKKSARDEAKAAFKQQAKAAKRAKLDPDQAKGTLQLQKEAAAAAAAKQQQNGTAAAASDSDDSGEGDDSEEEEGAAHERRQQGGAALAAPAGHASGVGQLAISKGGHGFCTPLHTSSAILFVLPDCKQFVHVSGLKMKSRWRGQVLLGRCCLRHPIWV
jgi:hypothetical protein